MESFNIGVNISIHKNIKTITLTILLNKTIKYDEYWNNVNILGFAL